MGEIRTTHPIPEQCIRKQRQVQSPFPRPPRRGRPQRRRETIWQKSMGCISPQSTLSSSYFISLNQSSKFENHPAHPNQEYWSLLDGDDHGTWVDARLTPLGESQARTARAAWQKQIERGIPAPQSYYVSPLNRCCRTARITFEGVGLPLTMPFRPIVKEVCRLNATIWTGWVVRWG